MSGLSVARQRLRSVHCHPSAGQSVRSLLEQRCAQRGDATFLVWEPFDGPAETWSYARFTDEVRRVAGALDARGTRSGDRILIHLDNCPEFLIAWFACAWLGAVAVCTNTRAAVAELDYFAGHSGVSGAFTSPELAAVVSEAAPDLRWMVVTGVATSSAGERFADVVCTGEPPTVEPPGALDPLTIQYTSGTTSRPKAVVWTHANGVWGARLNAAHQHLRRDDVCLTVLPLFHANALGYSTLGTLFAGGTMVLQPKFSASRFWDVSIRNRCTAANLVPFCVQALDDPPGAHGYRHWGMGISWPKADRRFGVRTLGWWGMTETISHPIVAVGDGSDRPYSMGRPSPEYGVAVVGDDGATAALGEPGHLLIAGIPGVSLFGGYLHNAEATEDSYDEAGWFRTGDRVVVHEDGAISFVDRAKDMLKVGGENVAASEIERVAGAVPGVRDVAAVGRPDRMLGEVPVVFVVADTPTDELSGEVLARCAAELADFKVPVAVHFIEEMPRATLDKVAKAELRKRLEALTMPR